MLKQTVFNLEEDLRTQFKLATIQRRTTIKAVLTDMVKEYVAETEDMAKKKVTRKGVTFKMRDRLEKERKEENK